jgi:TPR repeat protein
MRGAGRPVALAIGLVASAPGATHSRAAERWIEARSPAFTVVSDGGEKDARRVLAQFEQVRALLQEVWPGARLDGARPVTILAVRDEAGLRALLPSFWENKGAFHPAGVAVSAPDRSWVALRMDVARFREDDDSWYNPYLIIFHEYVHLVLRLNFDTMPLWLNEGLAEFWGNTIIDTDRVYEGRHIPYHLRTLRERAPMPLAALFAVNQGSPEYSEQNRATIFYAQSWALVHYLVLGSDERRGQINRFAALLQAGRPAADAVREAFGDVATLDREIQSYVRRPAFRCRRRNARLVVTAERQPSRALPEAESLALRAAWHVALDRRAEARSLAGQALAVEPGLAATHEALALLAWREGKTEEAEEALARAAALPGASDFTYYLYGRLLLEGTHAGRLAASEAALRRAVELNPAFADAHATLARVMAERGAPLADTLPLAARAAQLEPGEIEHSLNALRLTAWAGGVAEARKQAETLLARTSGEDRAKVEALVAELTGDRPPIGVEADVGATCAGGDAEACASLARSLERGEGPAANPARAARLYEGACATGDRDACGRLGALLREGRGVAKDTRRAHTLLARACNGGSPFACGELGALLLEGGQGVPADPERGRALLERACELGHAESCATAGR